MQLRKFSLVRTTHC